MMDLPEMIDHLRETVRDLEEAHLNGLWHKASVFSAGIETTAAMIGSRLVKHHDVGCPICKGTATAGDWEAAGFYAEDMNENEPIATKSLHILPREYSRTSLSFAAIRYLEKERRACAGTPLPSELIEGLENE